MRASTWDPLYVSALALATLLSLYGLTWCTIVWGVHARNWQGSVLGIDISNTIWLVSRTEISLLFMSTLAIITALSGLILRRRFAVYALGATILCHFALWILMADNPYYTATLGYAALVTEGVALSLAVLLMRRGFLR